jgi:hypothetical protein
MSAQKLEERETLPRNAAGQSAPTPCADMRILWICRYCSKGVKLHWKSGHKIGQAQRACGFALFNIPRIANP